MKLAPRDLDSSYLLCRQISRRSQSSFWSSFLLMPPLQRRAMDALYAFMRHTDDLGDSALPVLQRREALAAWRRALDQALDDALPAPTSVEAEDPRQLLPAVADTLRRFAIPAEHLHAVIDGQDMDLTVHRYETFDELRCYCEKVASAVGLACIYVWGFRSAAALEPARQCGIAFQLTNILRDVKEDLLNGRVYLPQEDLRRWGYAVEDLRDGVADARFQHLVAQQIERARQCYEQGSQLTRWLERPGQRTFGMMCAVYHRLLERIAARPEQILRHRVRLGRWEKLCIAARWLIR